VHAAVLSRRDAVAAICRRFGVARLEVFGSAARGVDFREPTSDVDLLVSFAPGRDPGMAAFLDLREALAAAFGRPVDLVERAAVEGSRNPLRRAAILGEAEAIFTA
jgi:predicted nucleotidyltransferase